MEEKTKARAGLALLIRQLSTQIQALSLGEAAAGLGGAPGKMISSPKPTSAEPGPGPFLLSGLREACVSCNQSEAQAAPQVCIL